MRDDLNKKGTQAGLARVVGITQEGVSKSHKQYLTPDADLGQWVLQYCSRMREQASGRGGGGVYELTEERARLAHHQANKTELEEQELRGDMVRIGYVSEKWATVGNNLKNKMRGLPHKVAHKLQAATEYQDVLDILIKEIDEAMIDLADGELLSGTHGRIASDSDTAT